LTSSNLNAFYEDAYFKKIAFAVGVIQKICDTFLTDFKPPPSPMYHLVALPRPPPAPFVT